MKKRFFLWLFLVALVCPNLPAQTPVTPPPANQESAKLVIPEGTQLQLSMREPVSSKLSEVGDEVLATVKKDVVVDGVTLLKAGTEVIGRVTIVKPAKRPLKGGMLHLSFDRIRLDNGLERKLVAVVQSASDFARDEKINSNGEGTMKGGKSGGEVLRNVGAAAGIGSSAATIIILAGSRGGASPFGFAGIGAGSAIGAASVIGGSMLVGILLTKGKEVRLDPGSIVRLTLERPLSVE
jgi:hypothetical protein